MLKKHILFYIIIKLITNLKNVVKTGVMNIYNQNRINNFSNLNISLFKNRFIPTLTNEKQKIFAIALCAIGFLVFCILSFKPKSWSSDKKANKENTNTDIQAIAKVLAEAQAIKAQAQAEAEKIKTDAKTQADAEAVKIKTDAKAQANAEAEKIKTDAKAQADVEALKIKTDAKAQAIAESEKIKTDAKAQAKIEAAQEIAEVEKYAFGQNQWKKYFGDIGKEPPLPKDIYKILKSPCPFVQGKKVEETHMLVLIPETVNGKPLDLNTLGELVKAPKAGNATKYLNKFSSILKLYGNQPVTKSHWVLMTKDVIEGSRNKSYADQQALIANFAQQTGNAYEVPEVLDAATCIFMHYVHSKEHLFNDKKPATFKPSQEKCEEKEVSVGNLTTFTRCQEKFEEMQVTVGCFSSSGLMLFRHFDTRVVGVAALRKFF